MKKYTIIMSFLLPSFLTAHEINWPLLVKSHISGTFAEFRRPGTLHMGIDIKTYGMNGFRVVSPFKGYINFLRYSPVGYGLSVDIYSPQTGMSARYAHLLNLKGELADLELLKNAAWLLNDTDPVSLRLPPNLFKTSDATVIGRTGESGSGISHLHFELMNASGYLNPLVVGKFAKNDYHPPVIRKVFIEDASGREAVYEAVQKSPEVFSLKSQPEVTGKFRIKVEGYDTITARNRNNLFALKLLLNDRETYSKKFDEVSWKDYKTDRFLVFDSNRSSLIPPVYVYNLFNGDGYSADTAGFNQEQIRVRIILSDASDNHSVIEFPVLIRDGRIAATNQTKKLFVSADSGLALDFSRSVIYGNPQVVFKRLEALPEKIQIDGLIPVSAIYEITTTNFTWYQPARGSFNVTLNNGESIYLYNTETGQWNAIHSRRQQGKETFDFNRPGILAVMKDKLPPVIRNPYLMTRNINLEPDQDIIEKVYAVSDSGSGIVENFEVKIEDESYPYFYDRDRKSIIIEIPRIIGKFRKVVPLKIRARDRAGNRSEWFTDLIRFAG